jgi:hypothetical protein
LVAPPEPPFAAQQNHHRQLSYIDQYVGKLGCRSLLVESRYIDRDHIEDHSVFYSRSLHPYTNYCDRVHFFTLEPNDLEAEHSRLRKIGAIEGVDVFRDYCGAFSERAYLGFCIIKPLPGSPVGRTVVRCYPKETEAGLDRDFACTKFYTAHVAGLEFTVRGLAFQQQDLGVSACATTALWTAFHKLMDFEDIAPATPAKITSLAARYSLPHGRAMPSEGLSLDQMCQAVQGAGVSPNLLHPDGFATMRGFLYSCCKSGFAPVLILDKGDSRHAVTAVGMKRATVHTPAIIAPGFDDAAGDLKAVYVHDDRYGPYLRGVIRDDGGLTAIDLEIAFEEPKGVETWHLTHILIPMHPKVRLAFAGLRELTTATVVPTVQAARVALAPGVAPSPVHFQTTVDVGTTYVQDLLVGPLKVDPDTVLKLSSNVRLSRYVGVIRLSADGSLDPFDVLVDTTSTSRNIDFLAIVPRRQVLPSTLGVCQILSERFSTDDSPCPVIA